MQVQWTDNPASPGNLNGPLVHTVPNHGLSTSREDELIGRRPPPQYEIAYPSQMFKLLLRAVDSQRVFAIQQLRD
jgi:hypothetical protein